MKMYKKVSLFFYLLAIVMSVQGANWYEYEYDASKNPADSNPKWKCCTRKHVTDTADGIYKCVIPQGKGWDHWVMSGKEFDIPEDAKGATVEFKVWAPATGDRGLRLQVENKKNRCWVMFLKNSGKEQILQIRSSKKDKILKLQNQFVTVRMVITRKNGYDKAAVYLNNSKEPVISDWQGFGKKLSCARIGFGAYSTQKESGTLLVDYIRWNSAKAIVPQTNGDNKSTSFPQAKVKAVDNAPVVDGELNDKCYKSIEPIKLYVWRKGKVKQPAPEVELRICRDGKNLYLAFDCKEHEKPKVSKKLPRDTYVGKTDTLEIFLDPALSRSQYYQIALNISNTLYDKFSQDGGWNGNIKSAVKVNPTGWTAEMVIDTTSMDKTAMMPVWGANFNYIDAETRALMTWAPVKNGHHEPNNFGLLILDDKAQAGILSKQANELYKKVLELENRYSKSPNAAQKKRLAELKYSAELLVGAAKTSGKADKLLYVLKASSDLENNITQFEKDSDRDLPLKIRKKLMANRPWCAVPVNSIIKPGMKYCPPLKIPEKIKMCVAKGEHESYQLIVYNGEKEIRDGKITLSPLVSKSAKIPVSNVKIWQLEEVILKTESKCNPFTVPGDRVPDPLVPCNTEKIRINKNSYKTFRITVHVPRNLPAGIFKGTVKLKFGDKAQIFPVELKVWNFQLPVIPNLKTSFSVWDKKGIDVFHNAPRGTEKHRKIHTVYKNTLLEYRVTPREFPYDFDSKNMEAYGKWLDERRSRGATIVHIPFREIHLEDLAKIQRFLEKKKLIDITYTRTGDEPEPKHFKELIKRTLPFKKQAPKIRNMVAGNNGFNELVGIIDAWCPLTNAYSTAWAEKQRKKGKQVWWYVCNVPQWPYANFFTDNKGIELRALLWQTYFYKADGLLYWNTVNWRRGNPWKVTESMRQANGDGVLFYPGNNAPLPSLRLEILRDGIDDYDYLTILDKMLKKDKAKIPVKLYSEAKSLLDVKALCGDLRNYSRDSEAYLKRREAIGNMIDKLQKYSK